MSLDKGIHDLLEEMLRTYDILELTSGEDTKPLSKLASQENILKSLAQTTIKCGHFIQQYCQNKSFGMLNSISIYPLS